MRPRVSHYVSLVEKPVGNRQEENLPQNVFFSDFFLFFKGSDLTRRTYLAPNPFHRSGLFFRPFKWQYTIEEWKKMEYV